MAYSQAAPFDAQRSHLDVAEADGMFQVDLQTLRQRRVGIETLIRNAAVFLPLRPLKVPLDIRQIIQRRLRRTQVEGDHCDRGQDRIGDERNDHQGKEHAAAHSRGQRTRGQVAWE